MRLAVAVLALGAALAVGPAAAQSDEVILETFRARAKVCGIVAAKAEACGIAVPSGATRQGIADQTGRQGHSQAVQDGLAEAWQRSHDEAARAGGCTEEDRSRVARTLPMCTNLFE